MADAQREFAPVRNVIVAGAVLFWIIAAAVVVLIPTVKTVALIGGLTATETAWTVLLLRNAKRNIDRQVAGDPDG